MIPQKYLVGAAAVAAVAVALWLWKRGLAGVAEDIAGGAVAVAGGAAGGAVKGGASMIGIPDTNADLCRKAIAEGKLWDASFYCTALEFAEAGGSAFFNWFQPTERTP